MAKRCGIRILSIEDEPVIAGRLKRLVSEHLGEALVSFANQPSVEGGIDHLENHAVDLLFLDLNLQGDDGFDVLEKLTSFPAQTIIVSAYADRAARAFDYGVIDFVTKPFDAERLAQAVDRFYSRQGPAERPARFLSFRSGRRISVVEIEDVMFARGADRYSEILVNTGDFKLHDKSLSQLEAILPARFRRVHKSYIVNFDRVTGYETAPGNKFELVLDDGSRVPVSRSLVAETRAFLS